MYDFDSLHGELKLSAISNYSKYNRNFYKLNPDYFRPDGTILFCGKQGAGKTLSAVRYIERIASKYPKCKIVSNIQLNLAVDNEIIPYTNMQALSDMDNSTYGILAFIDEIQILFNSLESKKISPTELAIISQQRKRRLHLVGTTQVFGRVAKAFREQVSVAVDCTCHFGFIQRNHVIDMCSLKETAGDNLSDYNYSRHFTFIRDPVYFEKYDTYQRISKEV